MEKKEGKKKIPDWQIPDWLQQLRDYCDKAAQKPRVDCTGCFDCCINGVSMSEEEKEILAKYPELWGKGIDMCRWLDNDGRCSVYPDRPIMCRAFGIVRLEYNCEHNKNNYYPINELLLKYLRGEEGTHIKDWDKMAKESLELFADEPEKLKRVLDGIEKAKQKCKEKSI